MNCNKKSKRPAHGDVVTDNDPSQCVKDPESYLNFRLDILSNEAMQAVDSIYLAECGLDVRHLRILRLIGHQPGITFSNLARLTRLERGLTSRIVTALTAKRLIERQVSSDDARQFYLNLTRKGEAVRVRAGVLADQLENLLLAPLSEEERATLSLCLEKLTGWVRQGGGLDNLRRPVSKAKSAVSGSGFSR